MSLADVNGLCSLLQLLLRLDHLQQLRVQTEGGSDGGSVAALANSSCQQLMECLCCVQLLSRLEQLRQLRVQTGMLDLQPPQNDAGLPTYRGAAGESSKLNTLCKTLFCRNVLC